MEAVCVPAGPGDAATILDMMRDYYPIEGAAFRPEVQGAALRALLADPALGRVYLVRRGGAIAGHARRVRGRALRRPIAEAQQAIRQLVAPDADFGYIARHSALRLWNP